MLSRTPHEHGFILVSTAIGAVMLLGVVGLAVDIGRMYIVKSEAQAFADSAAVSAALKLNGTLAGLERARTSARANGNRHSFSTASFTGTEVEFSIGPSGPWFASPVAGIELRFVRVKATANVDLYFLPSAVQRTLATVNASAVAGQFPKTTFPEGLFPFSPIAHIPGVPSAGFVRGGVYTLRWGTSPTVLNACPNDRVVAVIATAVASGNERGYIELTNTDALRKAVINDFQSTVRQVGDTIVMTGGAKTAVHAALVERIGQDTDQFSARYADYAGNGRRIVAVPVNDGGTPAGSNYRLVTIAAFFLLPAASYSKQPADPWCAEYIGPWVQGSTTTAAGNGAGSYVVRLAG